jgi:hypothetical protein
MYDQPAAMLSEHRRCRCRCWCECDWKPGWHARADHPAPPEHEHETERPVGRRTKTPWHVAEETWIWWFEARFSTGLCTCGRSCIAEGFVWILLRNLKTWDVFIRKWKYTAGRCREFISRERHIQCGSSTGSEVNQLDHFPRIEAHHLMIWRSPCRLPFSGIGLARRMCADVSQDIYQQTAQ